MSIGYIEQDLSAPARDVHRALASLQEELEAIDSYQQRADRTEDQTLKAILLHNRNDEMEHAAMLAEWLRRHVAELDAPMKTYLFTQLPITELEAKAKSSEPASLGIGNLR
jgi:ferritin-like protein